MEKHTNKIMEIEFSFSLIKTCFGHLKLRQKSTPDGKQVFGKFMYLNNKGIFAHANLELLNFLPNLKCSKHSHEFRLSAREGVYQPLCLRASAV